MAGRLLMRGVIGRVMWSYWEAATVRGYTLHRDGTAWSLVATLTRSEPYQLDQRPLRFEALYGTEAAPRWWVWPIETFELSDGRRRLTARLGPQVE